MKNKNKVLPEDVRGALLTISKYSRVKTNKEFELFPEIIHRTIWDHQAWLWERQLGRSLNQAEKQELVELEQSILRREQSPAGRTLYLGGTPLSKQVEVTQFNCAFLNVRTVKDVVDFYWLLLNGCGVGGKPTLGLNGFFRPIELEVIKSSRQDKRGKQINTETFDKNSCVWKIQVGDSAEAWAKFVGKIIAHLYPSAKKLILDFSQIRPAGMRLSRYGWISSGDKMLIAACEGIVKILNRRCGCLLSKIDILDILNHLGTTLSSRRSAEIMLMDFDDPEWHDFATAKKHLDTSPHRGQSNNSTLFYRKPSLGELSDFFDLMLESGGSEPGIVNAQAATARAPWFEGVNPCVETLLMSKSFCNLWEINLASFKGDSYGLQRAIKLAARANYRQTCVNLNDGILQEEWHRNNNFLRLCGLGLTGIQANMLSGYGFRSIERMATLGFHSMAHELGLNECQNGTLVKPSGTLSKAVFGGVPEGIHGIVGQYIFNNVNFGAYDPVLNILEEAGFHSFPNPYDPSSTVVRFPQNNARWNLKPAGQQSAISQLERYKLVMNTYCHQNVSTTISYSKNEVPEIVKWIHNNWDTYLATAWLLKQKEGIDLGYKYLPQQEVDKKEYDAYLKTLKPINIAGLSDTTKTIEAQECASGMCPVN